MATKLAALVLMVTATQAYGAIPEGTYSNVCVYSETMDQGGIELQIRFIGEKPSVSLKTCQGGCWQQPTSGIVLSGDRMTFSAADQDFTQAGALAHTEVHAFTGTFRKGVLIIESHGYLPPQRLQKQSLLSARALAKSASGNDPSTWPAPVRRCR